MSAPKDCQCLRARHRHGTRGAYRKDGCRCFPCRMAESRCNTARDWSSPGMWVPRCGIVRRIEALHFMGWSGTEIGKRLGVTHKNVWILRTHRSDVVLASTAAKVEAVFERLCVQRPEGVDAARTRAWARRKGFLSPLAWDDIDDPAEEPYRDVYVHAADRGIDEIAVQEAMRGRRVHLYPAEKAEALRRLTERGYSAAAIADRLGTTQRSVVRTRSARGIRGAA